MQQPTNILKPILKWFGMRRCRNGLKSSLVLGEWVLLTELFISSIDPPSTGTQVCRLFSDNCTSNLNNHMKACQKQQAAAEKATAAWNGEPPLQQSSLVPFVQGSTYTHGRLRRKQVYWAARCHRPYQMFEDPEYHNILHMMNANIRIPSADTVSWDVKEVYTMVKKEVKKLLQVRGLLFLERSLFMSCVGCPW